MANKFLSHGPKHGRALEKPCVALLGAPQDSVLVSGEGKSAVVIRGGWAPASQMLRTDTAIKSVHEQLSKLGVARGDDHPVSLLHGDVPCDDLSYHAALGQTCGCDHKAMRCHCPTACQVELVRIGGKLLDAASAAGTLDDMYALQGVPMPWHDFLRTLRGTSATNPSLQLRRTFWLHVPSPEVSTTLLDIEDVCLEAELQDIVDRYTGRLHEDLLSVPSCALVELGSVCAVRCRRTWKRRLERQDVIDLATALVGETLAHQAITLLERCGSKEWKMVMQKMVRLESPVQDEEGDALLVGAALLLAKHPGSFLPDLQKYMRGCRSMFQRGVIIAAEDGIEHTDLRLMLPWTLYAAVCQHCPTYTPAPVLLVMFLEFLLRCKRSPMAIQWRPLLNTSISTSTPAARRGETLANSKPLKASALARAHSVLEFIGAMPGDRAMISGIAEAAAASITQPTAFFDLTDSDALVVSRRIDMNGTLIRLPFNCSTSQGVPSQTMQQRIWRSFDQHGFPGLAHCIDGWGADAWKQTTGANFRRDERTNPTLLAALEPVQRHCWRSVAGEIFPDLEIIGHVELATGVSGTQAIAFAAGGIDIVLGRKRYTVCFGSAYFDDLRIVETPSRGRDDIQLVDPGSDEYKTIVNMVQSKSHTLHGPLAGSKLVFCHETEGWCVVSDHKPHSRVAVEEYDAGTLTIPVHPASEAADKSLWDCAASSGDGIRSGAEDCLRNAFSELGLSDQVEVLSIAAHVTTSSTLEMEMLGRGDSAKARARQAVQLFLMKCSNQFPGALEVREPGVFRIRSQLLFLVLKRLLRERFLEVRPIHDIMSLPSIRVVGGLFDEQLGVCSALRDQAVHGQTQFFLHAPTGSGKTGATLSHLEFLLLKNEKTHNRARYIFFFTVNDAAATALSTEIAKRSPDSQLFIMDGRATASKSMSTPRPGWLHIVKYDHFTQMGPLKSAILEVAAESMAMYDEADCLFGPSQRGRLAAGVASLFVAVVWATATALRRFSDNIVPLQRVAANFSMHVPITHHNLLVFYTHLLFFRRPVNIEEERVEVPIHVDLSGAYRKAIMSGCWHLALSETFQVAAAQLLDVAIKHRPALLFVESAAQVEQVLKLGDCYSHKGASGNSQLRIGGREAGERGDDIDVCVLSKSASRAYNWGKRFQAIVSLPLMTSVASRVQIEGRILRLDQHFRKVSFVTVVPQFTILESLRRRQLLDDAWQVAIEKCGEQALRLLEERDLKTAAREGAVGVVRPGSFQGSGPVQKATSAVPYSEQQVPKQISTQTAVLRKASRARAGELLARPSARSTKRSRTAA